MLPSLLIFYFPAVIFWITSLCLSWLKNRAKQDVFTVHNLHIYQQALTVDYITPNQQGWCAKYSLLFFPSLCPIPSSKWQTEAEDTPLWNWKTNLKHHCRWSKWHLFNKEKKNTDRGKQRKVGSLIQNPANVWIKKHYDSHQNLWKLI